MALEALGTSLERNGVNGHAGDGVAPDTVNPSEGRNARELERRGE